MPSLAQKIETPHVPTGAFKTIGERGPKYEVGDLLYMDLHGDWMVKITLLESGEETEYDLSSILEDPEAL